MDETSSPGLAQLLIRRLTMSRLGWPRIWVLNCAEAAPQAGEILGLLPRLSAETGFAYLSLDRLAREHPLIDWANRFARLTGRTFPMPRHLDTAQTYLRFAAAARAAIDGLDRPLLVSVSDSEAIRQRPDGIEILSALRAVLNEAQDGMCAMFLLPDYLAACRLHADPAAPFFDQGAFLDLAHELASASPA